MKVDDASCSWSHPLPPFFFCSDVAGAQTRAAAAAISREREGSTTVVALEEGGAAAPWVRMQLSELQHISHLAVVSNARLLEVHIDEDDNTAANIRTYEGVVTEGGWFLHNVECDVAPKQTLKLKFFARKTKQTIDIAAICLVSVMTDVTSNELSNETLIPTVESRLQRLEILLQISMTTLMQRLNVMEDRLIALERHHRMSS